MSSCMPRPLTAERQVRKAHTIDVPAKSIVVSHVVVDAVGLLTSTPAARTSPLSNSVRL